jgi:diaminopimelate epimerase
MERPGEVTARVWERGVGETSASGTSAVAVAAATHGDGEVVVHFPGGNLRVRLAEGRAWLTGPAEPLEELPDSGGEVGTDR